MTASNDESFKAIFESGPKPGRTRRYRPGDVLELPVVRVGKEAVFVALDGKQEGIIETSELLDKEGKPTVSVGSRIAVRVVRVDRDTGLVSLTAISPEPIVAGLPNAEATNAQTAGPPNPVVVGMRVKGNVTGVERYGVFMEFAVPGRPRPERGLVPTQELGVPRGADLRKGFPIGKELEAAVTAIDERGRIKLSVVALLAAEEQRAYLSYAEKTQADASKNEGKAPGFGTLADLFKRNK